MEKETKEPFKRRITLREPAALREPDLPNFKEIFNVMSVDPKGMPPRCDKEGLEKVFKMVDFKPNDYLQS